MVIIYCSLQLHPHYVLWLQFLQRILPDSENVTLRMFSNVQTHFKLNALMHVIFAVMRF